MREALATSDGAALRAVADELAAVGCTRRRPMPPRRRSRALSRPGRAGSISTAAVIAATGTRSSRVCARLGSPGPKLTAGMPSAANRDTSVQPYFARTCSAGGLDQSLGGGLRQAG